MPLAFGLNVVISSPVFALNAAIRLRVTVPAPLSATPGGRTAVNWPPA